MTKTIELPSGRKVTIRPPTALDLYRVQGVLPDLGAEGAVGRATPRESMRSGIAMICALTVMPRFWADLDNPDADPPEGRVLFDLDMADFSAVLTELSAMQEEAAAKVRPLSATGMRS